MREREKERERERDTCKTDTVQFISTLNNLPLLYFSVKKKYNLSVEPLIFWVFSHM